ncbi:MAG TPA: amino acid adenylation domain-containing protein [Blastocatellia bacterium]|nr:amino acid adenylation domain-containing protein [Blastocatellia bacterium]
MAEALANANNLHDSALQPSTIVDLLRLRAAQHPEKCAYQFLPDGGPQASGLTYAQLYEQSKAIAAKLQQMAPYGARALVMYGPGLGVLPALFGCILSGTTAIPVPAPIPARLNRFLPRFRAIVKDARPSIAMTASASLASAKSLFDSSPQFQSIQLLDTEEVPTALAADWQEPGVSKETIACLLYMSGPIRRPRGAMLSHENLIDNMAGFSLRCDLRPQDVIVTWLPHQTAFGLVFGILQHLYTGSTSCIMPPLAFVNEPIRWLEAITRLEATHTAAPNFAYDLCVNKTTPSQRAMLDLSSLRMAGNGAEMIRKETLERFISAFEPCGFRASSFSPVYGLTEAMVVTAGAVAEGHSCPTLSVNSFGAANAAQTPEFEYPDRLQTVVGCGQPLRGSKIILVSPESLTEVAPGEVGEVWVSNPSVASGYWGGGEDTKRTFQAHLSDSGEGPFLRTGDLGFIEKGELFLTGRLKDLIINRGQNHYPEDIEATIREGVSNVKVASCVAFSVNAQGEERLVAAVELHGIDLGTQDNYLTNEALESIEKLVAEYHGLQLYALFLLRPGMIAEQSRDSIDRRAIRHDLLTGRLEAPWKWVRPRVSGNGSKDHGVTDRDALLAADARTRKDMLTSYLCQVTAETLDVPASRLKTDQSLLSYGADSLLVLELKNRIQADLGVAVPIFTLFESASISNIADAILERLAEPGAATTSRIEPLTEATGEHPLSYNQQSLWFLNQLAPESAAYNVLFSVRIVSEPNVPALRRAFQRLIDRHPSLRTTYAARDGRPIQIIQARQEVSFEVCDAAALNADELNELLIHHSNIPFDLERGPLARINLYATSAKESILLLAVHHIAIDMWSLELILSELGLLYKEEVGDARSHLPQIDLQYTDYCRWQAEMLAEEEGGRLWNYWQKQLEGDLPVLDLPTTRPRPAVQTYRGGRQAFTISPELTGRLKEFARSEGATLYTVLLAAFYVLLHRYSDQEDILVGTAAAGRTRSGLENIVGYFVNPLVLRAKLKGETTFRLLLGQVKEIVVGALEHQDYPLSVLVKRLQPDRDASRSPLFQVMFALEKPSRPENQAMARFALGEAGARLHLGGLELESLALEEGVAQFDITLMMVEADGSIFSSLPYNADLFDSDTIGRMVEHFQKLIEGLVLHPDSAISSLPILTEKEERLLTEWNAKEAALPPNVCIHHLFEAQAERTPDRVAVVYGKENLTYRELDRLANRLANYLRSLGVGPESLAGICIDRSVEMIICVFAVWKAGAAYVPLDPAYPKERTDFMLKDAGISVLLTRSKLAQSFQDGGVKVICLDEDSNVIAGHDDRNSPNAVNPHNLAYVIYTSGSTGKPKGVMIDHSSAINLGIAHQEAIYRNYQRETFRVSLNAPLSFDGCVERTLLLLYGHTLYVLQEEIRHDPNAFLSYAVDNSIDVLDLTPSQLKLVIEAGLLNRREVGPAVVLVGGEAIDDNLWNVLVNSTEIDFYNVYGPTECTINASVCRIKSSPERPTIGRPLANVQIHILDRNYNRTAVGVPGEIFIGGAGLARGYLNRQDLTAERFIPNAFTRRPGARLYRSFDKARYLPDGSIEFLGRVDDQVKIRGFRIEPGEVERSLSAHPDVRDVLVLTREDSPGDRQLVAYVVPDSTRPPSVSSLRNFLGAKLPAYMVPQAFVMLESLPLMPNGKVDRKSLPSPTQNSQGREEPLVAPRSAMEQTLADAWAEILGVGQVSVHDNFFDLGGHSLSATQLMLRIKEIFDVKLPMRVIFNTPTIAKLAVKIVEKQLQQKSEEEVAQVLAQLENLSDEEVNRLLKGETGR